MQPTTPSGDPGTVLRTDPRSRHGDVDIRGDLVDELAGVLRLASAITAVNPELAEDQLRVVRRMLRREVLA